ncbi:MAG: hypothetical protein FJY34_04430 [Betaproteobacteria bacterium]|nr:hypothetical protein [Betaproteobacteria bacterium]
MNQEDIEQLARRETLLKLAATGALGAGGILGLVREALSAGNLPATPGFRRLKGPVGVDATRASIGLNIKPGQTVMTGEGGEAVYVIGPDAFLQREKTKVTFEESGGVQVMRIVTGKVLSVFGKPRDRQRNLTLATTTATIGIRGTGCYIEAEDARTYFCLCYGEAEVTPKGDPKQKETIQTKHHDHPIYIHASGTRMIVPATVINHTDAELTLLENSVGRWPPFHGGGIKY